MGQVTVSGAYVGSLDFKNLAKPLRLEGEGLALGERVELARARKGERLEALLAPELPHLVGPPSRRAD